jgi:transcriptional regulator with XRE-family HTH domain
VKRLKDIRQYRGLSQERLAEMSGISRATIARIETRREYQPREGTTERLAETLGVLDVELLSNQEFDHKVEASTLDELLKLNHVLSGAAQQEDVDTDRYRDLFKRIDKVVSRFNTIAGPFTLEKRWDQPAADTHEGREKAG